jgi:CRISPR-associated protein (TIGR02710 family)
MAAPRALVLTVGTGTADQLEATLLTPLRKSIEKGAWERIVLLPSKQTEGSAFALKEAHKAQAVDVRALRHAGDEENVDACFEHFDRELAKLLEAGIAAGDVTIDFTRGTKAMSAALALAAVVHGVRTLRYICSGQRDQQGMVVPGTESPSDFQTVKVTLRRDLDRALDLLRAGQFAAAERLCAIPPVGALGNDFRWAKWAAQFWGTWDRFDYNAAEGLLAAAGLPRMPAWVKEFRPDERSVSLLGRLKAKLPREPRNCVAPCRDLAADLLANAGRRLMERQTEEVLVRAYRVVELIGQYRLFSQGFDSGDLAACQGTCRQRFRLRVEVLRPDREGKIQIGREAIAKLLSVLGDARAKELLDLDWMGDFTVKARNKSILIHGFRAKTRRDNLAELERLLQRVEEFFLAKTRRTARVSPPRDSPS